MAEKHQILRPSYLTGYPDCARRTVARMFPELIESAGYTLRRLDHTIGLSMGSAVHVGAKEILKTKLETGAGDNESATLDMSIETLDHDIADGVMWDRITSDRNAGQQQIARMVSTYRADVAPGVNVVEVEQRLEADVGDGYIISGKKDLLAREKLDFGSGLGISDLKTGIQRRSNAAQYGAYSLIDRAHDRQIDRLSEVFLARATLKKPQPSPVIVEYVVGACEVLAEAVVADVKRAVDEFARRLTTGREPPEGAFLANPLSMLCGEKYCSAWGTDFCRVHKQEIE